MTVLPSQRLSISQFYLGLAAGLMLFLLPNDAKLQIVSEALCEAYIFFIALVITAVLFLITKRYEAVGVSLMTMALLNAVSFFFEIVIGFSDDDAGTYWPDIDKYRLASYFLQLMIPFVFCLIVRLFAVGARDNNETRRDFTQFLSSCMKALFIIYVIVFVFKLIMPNRPGSSSRELELMIFERIGKCLSGEYENGVVYICWHLIFLVPLSFYLAVLVPKFRIWHIALIAALLGISVEIMQFLLNTSTVCTDDVLMLITGAILGFICKFAVNKLRKIITHGEDYNMLSFDFAHLAIKPKGEAQMLTEE